MGDNTEVAATAAATGIAAALSALKGAALELLGVPLPVVLAAATAAFAARSFLPPTTYLRAFASGIVWTLVGVYLSNLALTIALDKEPKSAMLAGVALLIAGLGPLCWPVIQAKLPAAIGRRIDSLGGSNGDNRNG